MRTLIGGVGYHDLCDHSAGPVVAEMLAAEPWPDDVAFEDFSYGPVHLTPRLGEIDPPPDRMIVIGAVERGRPPGTVVAYEWDRTLPGIDDVQTRIAEALTGIVGLDNMLIVTTALSAGPPVVIVVEIEPQLERLGTEFSPPVSEALSRVRRIVRDLVEGRRAEPLVRAPLGAAAP